MFRKPKTANLKGIVGKDCKSYFVRVLVPIGDDNDDDIALLGKSLHMDSVFPAIFLGPSIGREYNRGAVSLASPRRRSTSQEASRLV